MLSWEVVNTNFIVWGSNPLSTVLEVSIFSHYNTKVVQYLVHASNVLLREREIYIYITCRCTQDTLCWLWNESVFALSPYAATIKSAVYVYHVRPARIVTNNKKSLIITVVKKNYQCGFCLSCTDKLSKTNLLRINLCVEFSIDRCSVYYGYFSKDFLRKDFI